MDSNCPIMCICDITGSTHMNYGPPRERDVTKYGMLFPLCQKAAKCAQDKKQKGRFF